MAEGWEDSVALEIVDAAKDDELDRTAEMLRIYGVCDDADDYPGFLSDPFALKDFRLSSLRKFIPRVAVACLIFVFGSYMNNLGQAWLQINMAEYYNREWVRNPVLLNTTAKQLSPHLVLWDITYSALPYVNDTRPADAFAIGTTAVVATRFLILPGPLSLRWPFLCQFLVISGCLYLCRGFTIVATPLPNPDPTCKAKLTYPDNMWLEAWAILVSPDDITCLDVLFSGHTIALTTSMLFLIEYVSRSPWLLCSASEACFSFRTASMIIGVGIVLLGYYFIVASHFHYTVDVFVGAVLSIAVYHLYHSAIKICWFRKYAIVWYPLRWFERHSKDVQLYVWLMSDVYGVSPPLEIGAEDDGSECSESMLDEGMEHGQT